MMNCGSTERKESRDNASVTVSCTSTSPATAATLGLVVSGIVDFAFTSHRVCPGVGLQLPAGQGVHAAAELPPEMLPIVLVGHGCGTPPPMQNDPMGHALQLP